jgi:hypothetical protein
VIQFGIIVPDHSICINSGHFGHAILVEVGRLFIWNYWIVPLICLKNIKRLEVEEKEKSEKGKHSIY